MRQQELQMQVRKGNNIYGLKNVPGMVFQHFDILWLAVGALFGKNLITVQYSAKSIVIKICISIEKVEVVVAVEANLT